MCYDPYKAGTSAIIQLLALAKEQTANDFSPGKMIRSLDR